MFKFNFDIIKIGSIGTNGIIKMSIGIILFSILYRIMKYEPPVEVSLDEAFLIMVKFVFYSFLAGYIYLILKHNKFPEVDVLTFLTFLLACFEATHNFIISIGNWIASIIRLIVRDD